MPAKNIFPENIHPLTDFLRNHKRHIQVLKRNQQPTVLTLNGKAEVVIQDPKSYQEMLEVVEAARTRQGIAEGLASLERNEGEPAESVFTRLRKKHGFKAPR